MLDSSWDAIKQTKKAQMRWFAIKQQEKDTNDVASNIHQALSAPPERCAPPRGQSAAVF
jgi:hypothetical protein